MNADDRVDPWNRGTRPTQDEIDAWAEREHRRRAAWVAGPGDDERQVWARRYRWRALLGLEESRLGPLPEEVEQWAAREHKRRQEWLAGPSEAEQRAWQRHHPGPHGAAPGDGTAPPDDTLGAWVARERSRRQQWLAGPSEDERAAWAESHTRAAFDEFLRVPDVFDELPEAFQSFVRESELAAKGMLYSVSRVPRALWAYLRRAGEAFEREFYQKPTRRRVRY